MPFCRRPPPLPRLRRSSPAPSRGRGQCLRYQVSSRTRGVAGGQPCTGPWGYRVWGWRLAGWGNSFPLPCLSRSKHLASRCRHFCEGYHALLPAPPPRPCLRRDTRMPRRQPPPRPCLRRDTMHFYRHPHPARAFVGIPMRFCRRPPPRPRLFRRIPIHFCRRPPPRPRLRRDTHALLPAAPTPPAPSALLPRPLPGAWAVLAISGEQPCPALLQDLPMLWTVWISPRGERLTGRGNSFPLPCLQLPGHRNPCRPTPPAPSQGYP